MPATTRKQQRFMAMCATNPGKAIRKCPTKAVAREFMHLKKAPKKNAHGFY